MILKVLQVFPESIVNHYATACRSAIFSPWQPGGCQRRDGLKPATNRLPTDRQSATNRPRTGPDGGLSYDFEDGLEGVATEHVVRHLVNPWGYRIEGNACSRHFDHTYIVFAIPDCHGICHTDTKTVEDVLEHVGFAMVVFALAKPIL